MHRCIFIFVCRDLSLHQKKIMLTDNLSFITELLPWRMALVILSYVIVFLTIIIWSVRTGRLPLTMSDAAYSRRGRWKRLPHTLFLWAATFTLLPALFHVIPEEWYGMAHAYATSMVLAGFIPLVKRVRGLTYNVTVLAAGVFSQCCVCVICPLLMLVWSHITVLCLYSSSIDKQECCLKKNGRLVAEFVSWFNIATAIIIGLINN